MEPHEILRVRPDADHGTARKAWIVLSREHHPDTHGPNHHAYQARLNDAYAQFTGKQAVPRRDRRPEPAAEADLDLLFAPEPSPQRPRRPDPVDLPVQPAGAAEDALDSLFAEPTPTPTETTPDDSADVITEPAGTGVGFDDPLEVVLSADVRGGKRLPRQRPIQNAPPAPSVSSQPASTSPKTPATTGATWKPEFSLPDVDRDSVSVLAAGAVAIVARAIITRGETPAPLLAPLAAIGVAAAVGAIMLIRFAHRRTTAIGVASIVAIVFVEATVFLLAAAAVVAPIVAWRTDHRNGAS